MLVPFVVDVDSLEPDPGWTPAQVRSCHNNVLAIWRQIGLLAIDGTSREESRLVAAVKKLPQSIRPLWEELLERLPIVCSGAGWDGSVEQGSISEIARISQAALVDDTRAEAEFGFAEDRDEKVVLSDNHSVTVCRLLAARDAKVFRDAISASDAHVEIGNKFYDTWMTRFNSLAAAPIKQVVIVDRYAMARHHEPSSVNGLSGVERFLRLLNGNGSGQKYVTLYSAWTDELKDKKIDDVSKDLEFVLSGLGDFRARNVKLIKLIMVPNTVFKADGHDRFVRFGSDHVWDIGIGLEIFEGAFCSKRSSASLKTGSSVLSYLNVESDLAKKAKGKIAEIR
jgi:hypothetical protein